MTGSYKDMPYTVKTEDICLQYKGIVSAFSLSFWSSAHLWKYLACQEPIGSWYVPFGTKFRNFQF